MRRFARTLPLAMLGLALACGDGGTTSESLGSDSSEELDSEELPDMRVFPDDAPPEGIVQVSGTSASLNEVTHVFEGPRRTGSGSEAVSCTYFVSGVDEQGSPELEIAAGYPNEDASVYVIIRGEALSLGATAFYFGIESADPLLEFRSRLTFDSPEEFYEYGVGANSTASSVCSIQLDSIEGYAVGSIACRNIFATEGSIDAGSEIPASVTVDFDCPLIETGSESVVSSEPDLAGDDSGTGPTGGSCSGVATPCSLLSETACEDSLGCSYEEECSGYASNCYSQFYEFSCLSQDGCYWSTTYGECSGSVHSCSVFSSSYGCTGQSGCGWISDCTGTSQECSDFGSQTACSDQPGCAWVD